jgi:hypothetical protein
MAPHASLCVLGFCPGRPSASCRWWNAPPTSWPPTTLPQHVAEARHQEPPTRELRRARRVHIVVDGRVRLGIIINLGNKLVAYTARDAFVGVYSDRRSAVAAVAAKAQGAAARKVVRP